MTKQIMIGAAVLLLIGVIGEIGAQSAFQALQGVFGA